MQENSDNLSFDSEKSITFNCPICDSSNATVSQRLLDIPYYKDFHSVLLFCPDCGMRKADFANLDNKGPSRYTYYVKSSKDMETKVVRSANGLFSIPELGVEIFPATSPASWIRNVEGILLDIKSKIELVLRQLEGNELDEGNKRIETINQMLENKLPLTLIIEDVTGNSIILPAKEDKLLFEELNHEKLDPDGTI